MTDKPKGTRLWQEIALTLVLKGFVLAIIWEVWFSAPEGRSLDEQKVASMILAQQPQKEHEHAPLSRAR